MGAVVGLSMSKVKSRGADSNLRLANYECAVWGCWALLGFAKPACLKGFQFCRLPTIAEYCVRVRVKLGSSGVSFPCAHEPTSPRFRRWASIPPANRLDPRRLAILCPVRVLRLDRFVPLTLQERSHLPERGIVLDVENDEVVLRRGGTRTAALVVREL